MLRDSPRRNPAPRSPLTRGTFPSIERLRAVGVGAGYFSQIHYEAWTRIPEVTVAAVADLDEEKARRTAERFDIERWYTDYRTMLDEEQPDFVDVITPPPTHLELCEEAASHGLDVICQKPLAPTYSEAEALVATMRQAGVRFMVHENWRWQPWYREMKKLQEGGTLGDVTALYFRMRTGDGWGEDAYVSRQPYFRDYPRLLMFETGVHFVDTFRFLLGEITSVYARLRRLNPVIRGEDAGIVVFEFESGATAVYDGNRYNESETDDDPRYTFGTMRVDGTRGHARLHTDGRLTIKPLGEPAYDHSYQHLDRGFAGDSVYRLQRHFVDATLKGEAFESTGEDYLKTLRVVEACYAAAERGAVVHLGST